MDRRVKVRKSAAAIPISQENSDLILFRPALESPANRKLLLRQKMQNFTQQVVIILLLFTFWTVQVSITSFVEGMKGGIFTDGKLDK